MEHNLLLIVDNITGKYKLNSEETTINLDAEGSQEIK